MDNWTRATREPTLYAGREKQDKACAGALGMARS